MDEEELKPVPAEPEGGGPSWWIVCGECHGVISRKDKTCPHCKHPIIWDEMELKKVRK